MGEIVDELFGNIFDDLDNDYEQETPAPAVTRFDCTCIRESPKALLCDFGGASRWVPKSQIQGGDVSSPGHKGTLVVSAWMAAQWASENPKETAARELDNDRVTIAECVCLRDTEKAIQVRLPDGREEWFPRSQFRHGNELEHDGDSGTLAVSKWIASAKKLT